MIIVVAGSVGTGKTTLSKKLAKSLRMTYLDVNKLIKKELNSINPYNWYKAFYYRGLYDYAISKKRKLPCYANSLFFFMNPSGDIYPCLFLDKKIGNLKNFKKIDINSIKKCPINCWQTCTTSPMIKSNPHLAVPWILTNHFKNILGHKEFLKLQ